MMKANTIYSKYGDPDEKILILSVDAIKVPGGCLYITAHHQWGQINTVFVTDEDVMKQATGGMSIPKIDYEKAYKFLTNTEDK